MESSTKVTKDIYRKREQKEKDRSSRRGRRVRTNEGKKEKERQGREKETQDGRLKGRCKVTIKLKIKKGPLEEMKATGCNQRHKKTSRKNMKKNVERGEKNR